MNKGQLAGRFTKRYLAGIDNQVCMASPSSDSKLSPFQIHVHGVDTVAFRRLYDLAGQRFPLFERPHGRAPIPQSPETRELCTVCASIVGLLRVICVDHQIEAVAFLAADIRSRIGFSTRDPERIGCEHADATASDLPGELLGVVTPFPQSPLEAANWSVRPSCTANSSRFVCILNARLHSLSSCSWAWAK